MIFKAEEYCDLLRKIKVDCLEDNDCQEWNDLQTARYAKMLDSICFLLLILEDAIPIIEFAKHVTPGYSKQASQLLDRIEEKISYPIK